MVHGTITNSLVTTYFIFLWKLVGPCLKLTLLFLTNFSHLPPKYIYKCSMPFTSLSWLVPRHYLLRTPPPWRYFLVSLFHSNSTTVGTSIDVTRFFSVRQSISHKVLHTSGVLPFLDYLNSLRTFCSDRSRLSFSLSTPLGLTRLGTTMH